MSNDMKEKFIETTIELINEKQSSREVNLRSVARKIGCSHQNLYNYFKNYDALLWECMLPSIKRLCAFSAKAIENVDEKEDKIRFFFSSQIEFALENPGIYSLIWLDKLQGEPPVEIAEKLGFASKEFITNINHFTSYSLDEKDLQKISDILHSYIHGIICKLISNRVDIMENENYIKEVVENCIAILLTFRPKSN